MRRKSTNLEDEDVARFLSSGLDGGKLKRLNSSGGKKAFSDHFPKVQDKSVTNLFVAVKDLKFDEADELDDELTEALKLVAGDLVDRGTMILDGANEKFGIETKFLTFGAPEEAARGIAHFMCVDEDELLKKQSEGEKSIVEEITTFGTDEANLKPGKFENLHTPHSF